MKALLLSISLLSAIVLSVLSPFSLGIAGPLAVCGIWSVAGIEWHK